MKFNVCFIFVFYLESYLQSVALGTPDEFKSHVIDKRSSDHMQEFLECIACHDEEQPKQDYMACTLGLHNENIDKLVNCCKEVTDGEFCSNAEKGDLDFSYVCKKKDEFHKVETCFWKSVKDKEANDIIYFKKCRQQILTQYCKNTFTVE